MASVSSCFVSTTNRGMLNKRLLEDYKMKLKSKRSKIRKGDHVKPLENMARL